MPRQAVEEERGTMTKITDTIKSYYDDSITTANGYIESIKGMKMEEKAISRLLYEGYRKASPVKVDKGCQPHARPWHVYLHGEGVSCSGALINKWWIVTSYACNPRPNSSIASLGEHDLTVDEGTEQYIQVAEVIQHSPYRSPLHSLTMVRLSQPAQLNQYIRPIPLPTRCPHPGESCRVSGWGSTNPNPSAQPRRGLQCIVVPVVDDNTCMNSLPDFLYWSYGMVCAGRADTDNCMYGGGGSLLE
ncbi:unnamed protein product [Merluccius merluccius]